MFDRIVFVADSHIAKSDHDRAQRFIEFLCQSAIENQAVILLGDIFEYWLGPKHLVLDDYRILLDTLKEMQKSACRVFFMGGNRDFLFNEKTAKALNIEIFDDPKIIQLDGRRVHLTHGDALCLDDVAYLRMKRILQNPITKCFARNLPLAVSSYLAQKLRKKSHTEMQKKTDYTMDLSTQAVESVFKAGADIIVCGHVHKSRHQTIECDGRQCELYVLGDWYGPASYLQYDNGNYSLQQWA